MKTSFVIVLSLTAIVESRGVATAATIPTNPAHEKLLQLNEATRNVTWAGLLQESGERCDRATKSLFRMQDPQGEAYWSVACANGKAFSVTIKPDPRASLLIANCPVIERLTKIGCFEKMKDVPPGWRLGE